MNPIAQKLSEASVLMEGTPHPELVEMLRIGAEEIERLSGRTVEWQPITTVPSDTCVLLFFPKMNTVVVGNWPLEESEEMLFCDWDGCPIWGQGEPTHWAARPRQP